MEALLRKHLAPEQVQPQTSLVTPSQTLLPEHFQVSFWIVAARPWTT